MEYNRARDTQTSQLMLAALMLIIAIGVLGWRATTTFTTTSSEGSVSEVETLLETVTGPGLVRVAETDFGSMLVLIDGPADQLESGKIERIERLFNALYPGMSAPTIQQYPFAIGHPGRPSNAALAELSALGLMVILAGVFVLTQARRPVAAPLQPQFAAPQAPPPPQADIAIAQPSISAAPVTSRPPRKVDEAAKLARQDPGKTAAIIQSWLTDAEARP